MSLCTLSFNALCDRAYLNEKYLGLPASEPVLSEYSLIHTLWESMSVFPCSGAPFVNTIFM